MKAGLNSFAPKLADHASLTHASDDARQPPDNFRLVVQVSVSHVRFTRPHPITGRPRTLAPFSRSRNRNTTGGGGSAPRPTAVDDLTSGCSRQYVLARPASRGGQFHDACGVSEQGARVFGTGRMLIIRSVKTELWTSEGRGRA